MAAPEQAPRSTTSHGIVPAEWPAQAADTIVETIAKVRDRTTKPAIIAARGLVYGLAGAIMGTVAFILLLVLIVRVWANYFPGYVWLLYLIFAATFAGLGLWCLSKAKETKPDSPAGA